MINIFDEVPFCNYTIKICNELYILKGRQEIVKEQMELYLENK